jgi:hypothetical protein
MHVQTHLLGPILAVLVPWRLVVPTFVDLVFAVHDFVFVAVEEGVAVVVD